MPVKTPCAEAGNPCYDPAAIVITAVDDGLEVTFSSDFGGQVEWDFGDGSDLVVARGDVVHTYGADDTYTVFANPLNSAVRKGATDDVTVAA